MAEETCNYEGLECPYCGHLNHVESEDYDEDYYFRECYECDKKFYASQSYSVSHNAKPDCELNQEQHDFEIHVRETDGFKYKVCLKCDKYVFDR